MNKKLNDVTPSEWDRAARSNIPYDMTTEEGRQKAWHYLAHVDPEPWVEPADKETEDFDDEIK